MQMSVDKPFEAWEEVQRHGQDLADKLAQGFNGLIQTHITPPSFSWPDTPKLEFLGQSFGLPASDASSGIDGGVSAILGFGNRLGQAGVDFGASVNGVVQQFFRWLPMLPFQQEEIAVESLRTGLVGDGGTGVAAALQEDWGSLAEQFRGFGFVHSDSNSDEVADEDVSGFNLKSLGRLGRSKGTFNLTSTYDSRTNDVESSLAARGDLWRVEASHGSSTSTSGSENSSVFLVQLGPVLFFRDKKLLLPVHLSKHHVLWYGYDRKNGMHSLCPAVWTKHRRWLLMSMICLNPFACSFMDLQFPNGQLTYVSGEGITASTFLPVYGGLLQAEGQYPGEMRFSFSCKNKLGTRITPMVQWPDKSFTLGIEQVLAWQRSGLMMRPTLQFSVNPTFGGINPGLRAEFIHAAKEQLSLICGCSFMGHPAAFASISVGRSKWNGNVGSTGIVVRVETPLSNVGRPALSVQLNSGIEF